jgi:hypothetical protein
VRLSSNGITFRVEFKLAGSKSAVSLGNNHRTAEAAARAFDAEARKRGAPHRVNFPTDEERAAVEEYRRLGPNAWKWQYGGHAQGAAADAAPPLRKRSRSPGAKREGSGRKRARSDASSSSSDDSGDGGSPEPAARAAGVRMGGHHGRGAVRHASLEAFLRSISPPLSQARIAQTRALPFPSSVWRASRVLTWRLVPLAGRRLHCCCVRKQHLL